jgi:hypothetical protein
MLSSYENASELQSTKIDMKKGLMVIFAVLERECKRCRAEYYYTADQIRYDSLYLSESGNPKCG